MREYIAFLILAALCSCKPASKAAYDTPICDWDAPAHKELELYINQYSFSPTQGMVIHPDLKLWRPDVKGSFGGTTNQEGKPPYTASAEYKGTKDSKDFYVVTISVPTPNGRTSFQKMTIYSGNETEIWRDQDYRIGLRPHKTENSG